MRRSTQISFDLVSVASATVIAVLLRGKFDTVSDALIGLTPYMLITIGCASIVYLLGGMDRTPWRHSSVVDHFQVIVLTALAILFALVLTFALNRLEPVARSLPILQGGLIVTILITVRSAARFWHTRQIHVNGNGRVNEQPHETILVVGVNTVTELFLLSVKEFASRRIEVAGILAEEPGMRARAVQQKPVLGVVEDLQDVLQSLEVHGVTVDRIMVATAPDRLTRGSLEKLLEVERSSNIVVQFLSERLGFEDVSQQLLLSGHERNGIPDQKTVARVNNANFTGKFRRPGKRIVDVLGSIFLIFALVPVAIFVAFIVALDVGFPVIFWQQRPGLYGRPFKLYKFRTMRAPHDTQNRSIPDEQRSSAVGRMLRRIRLDELPQLYNVLVGDMSLIGPRPLLPRDQAPDYAARLSVRPGITGWAQVNGGRIISTTDKLVLDIWYVRNATMALDLAIVFRTLKMILLGDRVNDDAVVQARRADDLKLPLGSKMIPAE